MENVKIDIARMCRMEGDGSLKAFVDVVISDAFLIRGMRIVKGKNGLFVGMPRELGKDGRWHDNVFPISREAKETLAETLMAAYETN